MIIALITDTHIGVRNDNKLFQESQMRFFNEQFFPYIDNHKISTVIHLGDLVDRRKYINYGSAHILRNDVIQALHDRQLDVHWIIGNHDTHYKNTNSLNALNELYSHSRYFDKATIYENATEVNIGGLDMLFIPWICDDNYAHSMEMIEKTNATVAMGHLQLIGFEHQKGGHVETEGLSPTVFSKFDSVLSGHFHTRSNMGNVTYLGCPYEMTWADCDDPKGFHIFDTETKSLEFIYNPDCMFYKDYYDETKSNDNKAYLSKIKGKYVRIIVLNKTDQFAFDRYQGYVEAKEPFDLKVIDHDVGIQIDDTSLIEAEDTLMILKKTVEQTSCNNKDMLYNHLAGLYQKALNMD